MQPRPFALATVLLSLAAGSGLAADPSVALNSGRPVQALADAAPGWLTISAAYRFRFENRTGNAFRKGNDDGYGLNRILVDLEVRPKSWLAFHLQGQDARAPGKANATPIFRDPFDLRQAWVRLGEAENGWLRATLGRQELKYGAQRLIGPLDWLNTARQFDAVKVNAGRKDLNVDFFAASVVNIDDTAFNKLRDGNNLHGAYANLNRLVRKGTLEAYGLWRTTPLVIGERGRGDAGLFTTGFRYTRSLSNGFDFETELAGQSGTYGSDDIAAWGAYWIAGYTAPARWKPRVSFEYQYGSGDGNPNDGKRKTFDQLYPTGHLYQGTADIIGWQNVSDVRAGLGMKPHPKVGLNFDYFSFWLANRNDHLYAVNGRVAIRTPAGGARDKHVAQEWDVLLNWSAARHVTVGAGFGYVVPGAFLKQNAPGHRQTFTYLFLNYLL